MERDIFKEYPLAGLLVEKFPFYLEVFTNNVPFTRDGQFELHQKTIQRRLALGSVKAALEDDSFLKNLYGTLQAWGIGRQASVLLSFSDFTCSLRDFSSNISELEGLSLEDNLEIPKISEKLWTLISSLKIVGNKAKLVSSSKTLHHLLPDLISPIDRRYTQTFFLWDMPKFQYAQKDCFYEIFRVFAAIAKKARPSQYVGKGWNTSLSKVIDNAMIGLIIAARKNKAGK
jgi:hypothetical protein